MAGVIAYTALIGCKCTSSLYYDRLLNYTSQDYTNHALENDQSMYEEGTNLTLFLTFYIFFQSYVDVIVCNY